MHNPTPHAAATPRGAAGLPDAAACQADGRPALRLVSSRRPDLYEALADAGEPTRLTASDGFIILLGLTCGLIAAGIILILQARGAL